MKPIRLNELNPPDLMDAARRKPFILIPLGTTEWHADHLPLGVDSLFSQITCDDISALTGCVVAPLLSYGISRNLKPENGYFGTVDTIRVETLANLLVDLGAGYAKMGFKMAVVISGHGETDHFKAINSAISGSKEIQLIISPRMISPKR